MKFEIKVPSWDEVKKRRIVLPVAKSAGSSWNPDFLSTRKIESGIYIISTSEEPLYVGKCHKRGSKWANFDVRLRRHCQQGASRNSNLYQFIKDQTEVFVSMYTLLELDGWVSSPDSVSPLDTERSILLIEQALICHLKTSKFNRK